MMWGTASSMDDLGGHPDGDPGLDPSMPPRLGGSAEQGQRNRVRSTVMRIHRSKRAVLQPRRTVNDR